ncbi:Transcription factor LHW [Spatholobus suberectus]|nr:Transcription factor LHW [Spatholobus suberectus]
MAEPLNITTLRNKLKTLYAVDGWSYIIFWRIHPQNSLLLTVEDVYCEDQLGEEIVNTVPQVHLMGEGIVGHAALTGKHRWVDSDGQMCEDDSGLHQQFSSGIKTVVVISFKPWGVVQFGSKKKIMERVKFEEQTERLLRGIEDEGILDVLNNTVLSLERENCDLNGLLASISSENLCDWNLKSVHGDNSEMLLGNSCSSASLDDSFPSMGMILEEGTTPMHGFSSHLGDQLAPAIETQAVFSDRDSTDYSMNNLISRNPSFGTWSGEISSLDSLGQQPVSEIRIQDVADVHCKEANAFSINKLAVQDSKLTSLYSVNRLLDPTGPFQDHTRNSMDIQHSAQSSIVTEVNYPGSFSMMRELSKDLDPVDTLEEFSKFFFMDDLCQLLAPSPEHSICGTVTALDESQEFNRTSFGLVGSSAIDAVPVTCQAAHSSIIATANWDGQETSTVMHSSESMGHDLSCDQVEEWWGSMAMLTPAVSTAATDSAFSDCISGLNVGTLGGSGKRLFCELGTEEFLNGSDFEDQLTNRRQRTEYSPEIRNPKQLASHALVQPIPKLDMTNNLVHKKEIFTKSQVGVGGLWIDDRNSNTGRTGPAHAQPQKPVEHNKVTRKRARPGETTRPRPKDRQQIQDRIGELRGIVPNGGKCSIDSLLDRTIRYMIFLQSITKYADKLQEPNEPKLIEQANGKVPKDSSVGHCKRGGGGVTCAFEVEGQTMVCPIIVEDMGPPGQMLIEMLFEEQGSFLEIVDIVGGFGLNILKGKMEIRENKIWARFIVEANRHVTRIDVFWSLVRLLQQKNTSGTDSDNKRCDINDVGFSSMDKFEKTDMPVLPMVMTKTVR